MYSSSSHAHISTPWWLISTPQWLSCPHTMVTLMSPHYGDSHSSTPWWLSPLHIMVTHSSTLWWLTAPHHGDSHASTRWCLTAPHYGDSHVSTLWWLSQLHTMVTHTSPHHGDRMSPYQKLHTMVTHISTSWWLHVYTPWWVSYSHTMMILTSPHHHPGDCMATHWGDPHASTLEMATCSWQDVKIQLLTNSAPFPKSKPTGSLSLWFHDLNFNKQLSDFTWYCKVLVQRMFHHLP